MSDDTAKFRLYFGCWNGAITSRDSGVEEYDSEQDARRALEDYKSNWASIGYRVWFATIRTPDGKEIKLG